MKKAKGGYQYRSNSMDRISELPKDILQRILYFLSQKEAAQTSVLSKSWRYIWYTRANLHFLDTIFRGNKHDFRSIVDNILQRYYDQRLGLKEFHLSISLDDSYDESVSLLEKWIPVLTPMGVKEFRLIIYSKRSPGSIDLPSVVFEAKPLQDLFVKGLLLNQKTIGRTVLSKHLKILHVQQVHIEDETFHRIISSCPLIETMFIASCERLRNIKVNSLRHLKNLSFSKKLGVDEELCSIEIYPPSLEIVEIDFGNISFCKGADFRNLNVLRLYGVKSSLDHLSSYKFPSLEYLTLLFCDGLEAIQLFIDAPNILRFKYSGLFVPSISFATCRREWNSVIYVRSNYASSSWFLKLNELLKSLSQSNICLDINFIYPHDADAQHLIHENFDLVPDDGCNKPVVLETLKLNCRLPCFSPLLNGLFRICRPRNIGEVGLRVFLRWGLEVTEFLWKILTQRESTGHKQDEFRNLWKRDLEEVSLETKRTEQKEWRPATYSELLTYQLGWDTRFALKWRQSL